MRSMQILYTLHITDYPAIPYVDLGIYVGQYVYLFSFYVFGQQLKIYFPFILVSWTN